MQGLKRLMTFCQKKFPADPSKSVEYNAVKWLLEAWEVCVIHVHGIYGAWMSTPKTLKWREKPWLLKCFACNKTPLSRLKQENSLASVSLPLEVNNCQLICTKMYLYCKISSIYAQGCETSAWRRQYFQPKFLWLVYFCINIRNSCKITSFTTFL